VDTVFAGGMLVDAQLAGEFPQPMRGSTVVALELNVNVRVYQATFERPGIRAQLAHPAPPPEDASHTPTTGRPLLQTAVPRTVMVAAALADDVITTFPANAATTHDMARPRRRQLRIPMILLVRSDEADAAYLRRFEVGHYSRPVRLNAFRTMTLWSIEFVRTDHLWIQTRRDPDPVGIVSGTRHRAGSRRRGARPRAPSGARASIRRLRDPEFHEGPPADGGDVSLSTTASVAALIRPIARARVAVASSTPP
jgi:hypothetical protein